MPKAREQRCHLEMWPLTRVGWCILMNAVFIFCRIGNNIGPPVSKAFDFKFRYAGILGHLRNNYVSLTAGKSRHSCLTFRRGLALLSAQQHVRSRTAARVCGSYPLNDRPTLASRKGRDAQILNFARGPAHESPLHSSLRRELFTVFTKHC